MFIKVSLYAERMRTENGRGQKVYNEVKIISIDV